MVTRFHFSFKVSRFTSVPYLRLKLIPLFRITKETRAKLDQQFWFRFGGKIAIRTANLNFLLSFVLITVTLFEQVKHYTTLYFWPMIITATDVCTILLDVIKYLQVMWCVKWNMNIHWLDQNAADIENCNTDHSVGPKYACNTIQNKALLGH